MPIRLQKELRSLVWPWAAAMAAMGLVAWSAPPLAGLVAVPGALVLGAWAVGAEYSQRTLAGLLVQPIPRWQLGLEKLAVVLALLATLLTPAAFSPLGWPFAGVVGLTALLAASLAALLTLKTRTPRAGILFTVAVLFVWLAFVQKVPELVAAWTGSEADRQLAGVALRYGTLALTAGVVAALFAAFTSLEAKEETLEHVSVVWRPSREAEAIARPVHPLWSLARKEASLLQILLVVSALYVLAWLLFAFQQSPTRLTMAYGSTVLHAGLLALLGGAMVSAEERRLGVIPGQMLLPIPFVWQWLIKVAVSLALIVALAVGLPAVLVWLDPLVTAEHVQLITSPEVVLGIVAATSGAIYVSSLARNSLLAFLVSIPVVWSATTIGAVGYGLMNQTLRVSRGRLTRDTALAMEALTVLTILGFLAVLLAFAMRNHLAADRSVRRLVVQGLSILNYVIVATIAWALLRHWL